jgi:Fe2+ or Zn2+ uptake regulation protein
MRAVLAIRLRDKGLRVTQQRVAVLEFLLATPDHPTA